MIKTVLTCDKHRHISIDSPIPWAKTSYYVKWFNQHTDGAVLMMCLSTWRDESLKKPLTNRYNIVISDYALDVTDTSPNIVIKQADIAKYISVIQKDIWIIADYKIVQANMHIIDELYIISSADNYSSSYRLDSTMLEENSFKLADLYTYYDLPIETWTKL
jgi:dihydrofolate reductase